VLKNTAERVIALNRMDGYATAQMGMPLAFAGKWERERTRVQPLDCRLPVAGHRRDPSPLAYANQQVAQDKSRVTVNKYQVA
jgi:hypothetical protein